jgi:hypothetical protein
MTKLRSLLLAAALALPATPAFAAEGDSARETAVTGLSPEQRIGYRDVFGAIRAGDWLGASTRLAALPEGPLHNAARAELLTAKGSPRAELPELLSVLERAPDMPKADQIARLAQTRGATELPALPQAQKLVWVGSQPRRSRAEATKGDAAAAELEPLIQPLIKDNRPNEAEAIFLQRQDLLGAAARTEYQQRIAWSYYIVGNDRDARRLAALARAGTATGRSTAPGPRPWPPGARATARPRPMRSATSRARSSDCRARRRRPLLDRPGGDDVRPAGAGPGPASRRRPAEGTFYGIIASSALGIGGAGASGLHDYRDAEWRGMPQAQRADRDGAGRDRRERPRRPVPSPPGPDRRRADHNALLHLAADLDLASTQYWLAHNAPRGASVNSRRPLSAPGWQPTRGWRVDPSLAFAHALQESNFRTR